MECHSVKMEKHVDWESLRYLRVLHHDADGNAVVGEMVCNVLIANDLIEIFKALFEAGYPIEKMRLIDHYDSDDEASMRDNNTSCFNQRPITAGGRMSRHSFGMAVDINPKYNPYCKVKASGNKVVKPEGSVDYLNRSESFSYKIVKGDLCYRLFKQHGFRWGGDWVSGKDYQHFER
ncbi:MAG: M15 family metallopeptidase [Bacteroidales bacterium]|nr:M15 family metallopeptidase [Bacteroidales bacterium]